MAYGRTRKIFVKYVLCIHDGKYTQYRTENVKYMYGMSTNIIFCTNISGGAFSTLVDWKWWRTSIKASTVEACRMRKTGSTCRPKLLCLQAPVLAVILLQEAHWNRLTQLLLQHKRRDNRNTDYTIFRVLDTTLTRHSLVDKNHQCTAGFIHFFFN